MSRTTRHIPYWVKSYFLCKDWNNSWVMLGDYMRHPYFTDPRERIYHGYDSHCSRSYIYSNYPTRGWPETYGKSTRKFFKRYFSKQRRKSFSFDKTMGEY